ncbi:MAG: M13 family metallopeptidase [Thermoanaerobaculia bacterium]|nr:M13 family metallopeptidase [Thermoanaerobaculia bacterium]
MNVSSIRGRAALATVALLISPLASLRALAEPSPTAAPSPPKSAVPSLKPADLDKAVDPCQDFFRYTCGTWLKANPIPPEYPSWGRFNELQEQNRAVLRGILEKAAANPAADAGGRAIGDYWASCMDEARAEKDGISPIRPLLERIAALASPADAVVEAGRLRREGVPALFSVASTQDARDATEITAEVDQGGLGLPERDYYTKQDDASKKIRAQYVEHLAKLFVLSGNEDAPAADAARRVLAFETRLAESMQTKLERRDPERLYNRKTLAALADLAPAVPWAGTFSAVGTPPFASLNVVSPGYFKALSDTVVSAPLDDWKTYLHAVVLRSSAKFLSKAFVNQDFAFNGTVLVGTTALQPRWKRCVASTDANLRDLLGRPYADATFGADGKKRMQALVVALEDAMDEDLRRVPWMDDETRGRARAKLGSFAKKIGYPDKWVDMSQMKITRGSWLENLRAAQRFEVARDLAKIGKPLDRTEWGISVPTVNAGYNPQLNDITFPAGILQPPFFDRAADDALNFGAIGGVIGHEITHGFDDQGRQFDKSGNLKDWWTERSTKQFEKRAGCVERQFSDFKVEDLNVNGKLTLGENIADLGGVKIAWAAFRKTGQGRDGAPIDGFTPDQRFFLGWGRMWCEAYTPELARLLVNTNEHSPPRYRVNGPLSNMKEFQSAFHCPDDTPMVRKAVDLCEVW